MMTQLSHRNNRGAFRFLSRMLSLLAVWLLYCHPGQAQKAVSYVHDPFGEQGCVVIMVPAISGQMACLVVSVQSESLSFGDEVMLEMEAMDGERTALEGLSLGRLLKLGLTPASGIIHPEGMERQTAQFYLDGASIRFLEKGVRSIRLDTRPAAHEKTFKKDKIGKKLFKAFRSLGVILQ